MAVRMLYWLGSAREPAAARRVGEGEPEGLLQNWPEWQAWREGRGLLWVDLDAPNEVELAAAAALFTLPKIALQIGLSEGARPRVVPFDDFAVLTAYTPAARPEPVPPDWSLDQLLAVTLFMSGRFLLTVHGSAVTTLNAVWQEYVQTAPPPAGGEGMAAVVHHLLKELVDGFFPLLDVAMDRVDRVQELAFLGPDTAAKSRVSRGWWGGALDDREQTRLLQRDKRELLHLHRVTAPQRDALQVLARRAEAIFDTEQPAFDDVLDHALRIADQVYTAHEQLVSAREARLSRIANDLTVVARLFLGVTLLLTIPVFVGALYGMNFDHMPELRWPTGHLTALALIVALDGTTYLYLRRRFHAWR